MLNPPAEFSDEPAEDFLVNLAHQADQKDDGFAVKVSQFPNPGGLMPRQYPFDFGLDVGPPDVTIPYRVGRVSKSLQGSGRVV
jgi:hypothetical protein